MYDVIHKVEIALCNINKLPLQPNKNLGMYAKYLYIQKLVFKRKMES